MEESQRRHCSPCCRELGIFCNKPIHDSFIHIGGFKTVGVESPSRIKEPKNEHRGFANTFNWGVNREVVVRQAGQQISPIVGGVAVLVLGFRRINLFSGGRNAIIMIAISGSPAAIIKPLMQI